MTQVLANPFSASNFNAAPQPAAPLQPDPNAPIDAEFRPAPSEQIPLDEFNRQRLMHRVRNAWSQAQAARGRLDMDAKRDRRAYDMEEKPQSYKGQPNVTLPLTRNKIDGMIGQLISAAFDAEPLATATPLTEDAVDIAPIYDAAMERELKLDGADESFKMSLREAAIVGTSFLGFSMSKLSGGEMAVQASLTRFENFHFFPVEVDDLSNCTTFRRFTMPYFQIKEQALAGNYDMAAVRQLKNRGGVGEPLTKEASDAVSQVSFFDDENRPIELLEVFIRYSKTDRAAMYQENLNPNADMQPSELYQVICTKDTYTPLSVQLNPYREAFDMPPYTPMRVARRPGYLPGGSFGKLLRAVQKIADDAMNDRLAYNKFALTPILQGDASNPIFKRIQQGGRLVPGTLIPTNGRPDMAGVQALQLPSPVVTIEDMDLAMKYADMGTHSDFQLTGQMPTKRATAYETQAARGAGELKLRVNLQDFTDDAARGLKMFWAIFDAYKLGPAKVMPIYNDGATQLLSSDEITPDMFMQHLEGVVNEAEQRQDAATLQELAEKVQPNPETGVIDKIGDLRLVRGGVPSARRDDLSWSLSSQATTADKATLLQMLNSFAPYLQLLPQADQDSRIWEFLRMWLVAADMKNWKKLIGANPRMMQDPAQFQEQQAGFQQNIAQSSQR